MTEELHYLPATRLLELFKLRKLSPVELLEAQIDRAWKAEPKINAFTQTFYDQSLVMARKSEARYMRPNARLRALEGLTVAIKDEGAVKGQRSTVGSLLLRDNVAEESDVFNDRILKAGAICHARTATPEFCCAAVTHSRLWGVTRNPWNRELHTGWFLRRLWRRARGRYDDTGERFGHRWLHSNTRIVQRCCWF